ncbi:MAG: ANTAR domain-containing protein [Acidimicrobiales bacterium]
MGALNVFSKARRPPTPGAGRLARSSLLTPQWRCRPPTSRTRRRRARRTSAAIGQAKGMLMVRQHITAEETFAMRRRTFRSSLSIGQLDTSTEACPSDRG